MEEDVFEMVRRTRERYLERKAHGPRVSQEELARRLRTTLGVLNRRFKQVERGDRSISMRPATVKCWLDGLKNF